MTEIGVVVIAHNEGQRLVDCLESLPRLDKSVVVDNCGSSMGVWNRFIRGGQSELIETKGGS